MKKYQTRNLKDLLFYNSLDTVATARSYHEMVQDPDWNTDRVQNLWNIHTKLAKIAAKMHTRGMKVNAKQRRNLGRRLKRMHEKRKQILLQHVQDPLFTGSPNDMLALLYKRYAIAGRRCFNLEDPPEYDKDFWNQNFTELSVKKPALLKHYVNAALPNDVKEIIRFYWEARAPAAAKSRYVTGKKIAVNIGHDGRLRPKWNSCGTETLRWSCSEPNIMNLSEEKDDEELIGYLPNMRVMYEADDGFVLVHADVSQQELRFMAEIADDDALRQGLSHEFIGYVLEKGEVKAKPGDVYSFDCVNVFKAENSPSNPIKTQARKQIKIVHLAFQYAASTPTVHVQCLQRDRTLKYSQVKLFHNGLKRLYYRTVSYWSEELDRVLKRGLYSEGLLLGTRVYYPTPPAITETANKPVQTTAGESMAIAMINVDEDLEKTGLAKHGCGIWSILHDALDIETREDPVMVNEVQGILKERMQGPWKLSNRRTVKTPIDMKVAKSWGKV